MDAKCDQRRHSLTGARDIVYDDDFDRTLPTDADYVSSTENREFEAVLKFNSDLKHITDYRFLDRFSTVMEGIESQLKSQLQEAYRYSWRNATGSRQMMMDVMDNFENIKYDVSHELNLIRIQASSLSHQDDDTPVVQLIRDLKHILVKRFLHIQNPENCQTARKLVCDINKSCGFGCQIHHVAYCLIVAYVLDRVLIINDTSWSYAPKRWSRFFQPITRTCGMRQDFSRDEPAPWDESDMKSEYLHCTLIDLLRGKPEWLPPAVPQDLGKMLNLFHVRPFVWWMGQVVTFLLRPSLRMKTTVEQTMESLGYWGNIVGVHIRRTDKLLREGSYYPVKSYFKYVEEYFKKLQTAGIDVQPKVYLATDDEEALIEATESYPHIEILYEEEHIRTAGGHDKYNEKALEALLVDIYLLANTDFIICTLSSQNESVHELDHMIYMTMNNRKVCRVAYELMQSYHVDASQRVISLDQGYYFGGQTPGAYKVILDHVPSADHELSLKAGDRVFIQEFRGRTLYGMNGRTGELGEFPAYKVQEVMKTYDFPQYLDVT